MKTSAHLEILAIMCLSGISMRGKAQQIELIAGWNSRVGEQESGCRSVKVKLMTRWNVNGTVVIQDSVPVSHTWAKNNTGYWQRWNPRAVYNRDRSSSLWIIHFILFFFPHFKENTLRAKCNERISPWICSMLDGKASELPHFVIPPCQW